VNMTPWKTAHAALTCGAWCGLTASALAAAVSDYAVRVSATVQTNPPRITLSWAADPSATGYTRYRKLRDVTDWGTGVALGASATNYVDSSVAVGGAYEYWVAKDASTYSADGYIYAGMEVPLVESRGKVVLLVDNTYARSLSNELARFQQDLVGDGWTVLRHDVARMTVDPANTSSNVWAARSNELASVKALIKSDYNADTNNVKALFIFGHVPVPYSGNLAPDDHYEHVGAWPADAFYGDLDGTWTDTEVISTDVGDQRTRNVPGDGKFDQTGLPSDLELQVGRVDFANLPAFSPVNEAELLRRYLNKDHSFRHKLITAERRGLIADHLGVQGGWEAFAANGWRVFAPFFGATNSFTGDWLPTLSAQSYLWGYGCGGGTYTSASGVATTAQLVTNDPWVVFTMLFGSYFGDWDSKDNFLRATLGTANYTLASVWAGRPFWIFHHMALGETIGFSARLTQNNSALYSADLFSYYVHVALLGDPTLRMHIVAPPSGLLVATNDSGGEDLSWNASPDAVLGYHVYRAPTAVGPFTRLTTNLITGTSYTDPVLTTNDYMVRAVKLEVSASGSYYNASQGIFQSLDGTARAPTIVLLQPANNALFTAPTNIQFSASVFDPANCITNVTFFGNGVRVGEAATPPPYSLTWSNPPGGLYSLTARASCKSGWVTTSAAVSVRVIGPSPNLAISPLSNGTYAISGASIPGRSNRVEFLQGLGITNWQTLGTATATPSGVFQFIDTNGVPQRFYRSAYP
jgi:Bacterial Ig domain